MKTMKFPTFEMSHTIELISNEKNSPSSKLIINNIAACSYPLRKKYVRSTRNIIELLQISKETSLFCIG